MRELGIGSKKYTIVYAVDEPGPGGACHEYRVNAVNDIRQFAEIQFQKGPIKEAGVNGCHQEDLIAICIHRLQCFQEGKFACRENALALTKLQEALHWLRHRTDDRIKRNVEGTDVI